MSGARAVGSLSGTRLLSAGGTVGALLDGAARALPGSGARQAWWRRLLRRDRGGALRGVPLCGTDLDRVDAERVAQAVVRMYPGEDYPAVVLGSPHGAAAHLAVALGAPWLPGAFDLAIASGRDASGRDSTGGWDTDGSDTGAGLDVSKGSSARGLSVHGGLSVGRPSAGSVRDSSAGDPTAALMRAATAGSRIAAGNPEVAVRHVVAAPRAPGTTATLAVRWRALPEAYTWFLASRLRPDAALVLVRDAGGWVSGQTAQAISAGFAESLRHWAADRDQPLYRVTFSRAEVFSGAVADVYREWLRGAGKAGDRLAVECGRLLDPAQVVRAGLVPYWLPDTGREPVEELTWWLAGSRPYRHIDLLVDPPGQHRAELAGLGDLEAVTGFAAVRGTIDERAARVYPWGRVPVDRATEVLGRHPDDDPPPSPLPVPTAVRLLSEATQLTGMIVH
ncbi:MAG: hypothetical protein J2P15_11570 [Micromonosporaceae bacterium]|nr:hypothetical protein [Micromonosporaceae bacterium]